MRKKTPRSTKTSRRQRLSCERTNPFRERTNGHRELPRGLACHTESRPSTLVVWIAVLVMGMPRRTHTPPSVRVRLQDEDEEDDDVADDDTHATGPVHRHARPATDIPPRSSAAVAPSSAGQPRKSAAVVTPTASRETNLVVQALGGSSLMGKKEKPASSGNTGLGTATTAATSHGKGARGSAAAPSSSVITIDDDDDVDKDLAGSDSDAHGVSHGLAPVSRSKPSAGRPTTTTPSSGRKMVAKSQPSSAAKKPEKDKSQAPPKRPVVESRALSGASDEDFQPARCVSRTMLRV